MTAVNFVAGNKSVDARVNLAVGIEEQALNGVHHGF
jgi:hypothetical protein